MSSFYSLVPGCSALFRLPLNVISGVSLSSREKSLMIPFAHGDLSFGLMRERPFAGSVGYSSKSFSELNERSSLNDLRSLNA